ncbi:hypothetical protein CDAR_52271 [Caerostris darwini]|uniref:Uncharacterized protein n=1 Tax=Caerostris darwini TaxID=1538125 RepID=A0AAV4V280_9ARAC|nr:hypothetical protein CDAR_52271 [Caerostris darwini]
MEFCFSVAFSISPTFFRRETETEKIAACKNVNGSLLLHVEKERKERRLSWKWKAPFRNLKKKRFSEWNRSEFRMLIYESETKTILLHRWENRSMFGKLGSASQWNHTQGII